VRQGQELEQGLEQAVVPDQRYQLLEQELQAVVLQVVELLFECRLALLYGDHAMP